MELTYHSEIDAMPLAGSASLKQPLAWSVALHGSLVVLAVAFSLLGGRGESWGGAGGSGVMSARLVGSAGVPIPRPAVVTTSRVVSETKGLYKEEPPKPTPPPEKAVALPEFEKNKPQKYASRPSKVFEDPTPPPENAIPQGQGGAPAVPYNQFKLAGQSVGGLDVSAGAGGSEGAGGFGSRYPWYVDAVRRRISGNWLHSTVDPSVRWAPRAVVTFQILRDGAIVNLQILQSSGNSSVDNSARRAILSSSPVERLPSDYRGSLVNVEFWFEFRR